MADRVSSASGGASRTWSPLSLAVLASLWTASLGNWPLWRALARLPEMASPRGALFFVGFGLMIAALTTGFLALLAWRHTLKPAIAFVLLSAAVGAYFMGTYGIVLDPTMMTNVLQTDPREVRELLSAQFALNLVVLAVLPIAWLWRARIRAIPALSQSIRNVLAIVGSLVLIAVLIAAFFADLSATMRNHRSLRYLVNPVNSYYSLAV